MFNRTNAQVSERPNVGDEAVQHNTTVLDRHGFCGHDLPLARSHVEALYANNSDHILAHEEENVEVALVCDNSAVHYEEVLRFVNGRLAFVDLRPQLLVRLKMVQNL